MLHVSQVANITRGVLMGTSANAPIMKVHFKCILKKLKIQTKYSKYASEHTMSIHQSFGVKRHFLWPV
jgi:hypothetical protein